MTKNEYKTAKCGDAYKLMFDSYAFNWAAMGLENAGAKAKKKRVKDKDGDCEYLRYVHKVTHVQSHVNQIRKNIVQEMSTDCHNKTKHPKHTTLCTYAAACQNRYWHS